MLRRPRVLAGAAVAAGAYLATRVWVATHFPTFGDEAVIAWWGHVTDRDVTDALSSLTQGIRPGVPALTWLVMQLGFDPLAAIRIVGVVFGLVALSAGTLLAFRLAGSVAAAASAAFALLAPYTFLYDVLGNRDTVIAAALVVALLVQIEHAQRPSLRLGLALGITFALVMTVKDTGKIALVLLPLSLLLFPWNAPDRGRLLRRWLGGAAIAYASTAAAVGVMRTNPYYDDLWRIQEGYGATRPLGDVATDPFAFLGAQWPRVADALDAYMTVPLVVLVVAGMVAGIARHSRETLLVIAWVGAELAAVLLVNPTFAPRYLVAVVPLLLVLAAVGLVSITRLLPGAVGRLPAVAVAIAALALVPAALTDWGIAFDVENASYAPADRESYIRTSTSGLGVEEIASRIEDEAAGAPTRVGVLASDYSTLRLLLLDSPNVTLLGAGETVADPRVRLVVVMGEFPPEEVGPLAPVYVYERPHGGEPIGIWRRVDG